MGVYFTICFGKNEDFISNEKNLVDYDCNHLFEIQENISKYIYQQQVILI